MLAKIKLNNMETLISQRLIDMEISQEGLNTILKKKKNMRGWKKIWGMWVKNKTIWH